MTQTIRSAWSNVAAATTPDDDETLPPVVWEVAASSSTGTLGSGLHNAALGGPVATGWSLVSPAYQYAGLPWRLRQYISLDGVVTPTTLQSGTVDGDGLLAGAAFTFNGRFSQFATPAGSGIDRVETMYRVELQGTDGSWPPDWVH